MKSAIKRLLLLYPCPVIGFVGYSGSGKTTLLEQVITLLKHPSLRIAVIKSSHHDVDMDQPGKDSYRLRHAGADTTLLYGPRRWTMIHEYTDSNRQPSFKEIINRLHENAANLVLVEGFKQESFLKIAVHRKKLGPLTTATLDADTVAVATDNAAILSGERQILNINHPEDIAAFILRTLDSAIGR